MDWLSDIARELERGEKDPVAELVDRALAAGVPPRRILDEGLVAGMNVVGEKFRRREIFLPDVLLAARAMYAGLDLVRPRLEGEGSAARGTVVIGSVAGDLHDIGKNLVAIMLRGAGFEVVDLGHDVQPEQFVGAALEHGASVIGMSALLTTTMPVMRRVVALVKERGLAGRVHTIVGGAPVSAEFASEIGADAYGYDAANAVERIRALFA